MQKMSDDQTGGGGGGAGPMEADVTDEQMAQHYSSLANTMGNKFRTKRQRSPSREQQDGERTPSRPPVLKKVKAFLRPGDDDGFV